MDLFGLPRDVVLHLVLHYVDPLAALRLACVSRGARDFYLRHAVYERLYRRAYAVHLPRGGKGWRKRREKLERREKDPVPTLRIVSSNAGGGCMSQGRPPSQRRVLHVGHFDAFLTRSPL